MKQGAKKMGNRNAYLASAEYHSLYRSYQMAQRNQPKEEVKETIYEIVEDGSGYTIKIKGENAFLTGSGTGAFGVLGGGAIFFKRYEGAIEYAKNKRLNVA